MPRRPPPLEASRATQFKKGQVANPGGRVKGLLTRTALENKISVAMNKTAKKLKEELKSGELSAIDAMIASIICRAVDNGDHLRLDFVLNRILGKVKDVVEVDSKNVEIKLAYNNDGAKADGKGN
jgi:hypothetical protein